MAGNYWVDRIAEARKMLGVPQVSAGNYLVDLIAEAREILKALQVSERNYCPLAEKLKPYSTL